MADKSIARNGRVGGRGIYRPSEEEFVSLARSHRVVTVSRTVSADTETPVTAFLKLARGEHAFLLESAEGGERWGRYSFIGREPQMVMSFREGALELPRGKGSPLEGVNPVSYLCELMAGFGSAWCGEELPFAGGAVGYLAYDLLPYLENIELHARGGLDVPEMMFMLTRCCAAFDHLTGRLILLCNVHVEEGGRDDVLREEYRRAISDLESMARDLGAGPPHRGAAEVYFLSEEADFNDASCNFSRAEYEAAVERAREYIHAGEAFQVVPSQRFTVPLRCSPFSVYRSLRSENPSPYMFFLRFGDLYLIGSSPEPMVRRRGDRVVIRPIAGTRPRGATPDEDRRLEEELLRDEKEQAEHVMLVDLARNDLGRVCQYGTVKVSRFMEVEQFSHVMHIVSEVQGHKRQDMDAVDVFKACFPAGTLSGAPKVRAMEIIDELEPCKRGPYGGAVGYFGFSGNMDTCITIRTAIIHRGNVHVQAGAGIVFDSDPEKEHSECIDKAQALLSALKRAKEAETPCLTSSS